MNYLRKLIHTDELGKLELVIAYLSQDWMNNWGGT